MIPREKFDSGIRLYNLADIHRGHQNCNEGFLARVIKQIKDDDRARWVSTGDLCEMALKTSKVADPYVSMSPKAEKQALEDELRPIADKCLGVVESNHHRRLKQLTSLNFDDEICKALNIPFLGIIGVLNITCGRASYFIAMHHGAGGGTMGNKINRARRFAHIIPGADIYLTGHTHSFSLTPLTQRFIDKKRNALVKYTAKHVVAGHFLEYEGSYAEEMMIEPMPMGVAYVDLDFNGAGNFDHKKTEVGFIEA